MHFQQKIGSDQNQKLIIYLIIRKFLSKKIKKFNENNIKLQIIGEKNSQKINNLLNKSEKLTKNNFKLQVNLAKLWLQTRNC